MAENTERLLIKLGILKYQLIQFINKVISGKTSIQKEIFREKMFCRKCSFKVIRASHENSWKASSFNEVTEI